MTTAGATNATGKKRRTDREIIVALKAAGGMVHLAARAIGVAPSVIYNRRDKSEAVWQAIEDQRGELLDIAETSLKRAVIAGEAWAVCFSLKTIGKNRGYVERRELTGNDGAPIQIEYVNDWRAVTPAVSASGAEMGDEPRAEVQLIARGAEMAEDDDVHEHSD